MNAGQFHQPVEDLLSRLMDGPWTEADSDRLTQVLRDDPDARKAYHAHIGLHAMLHWKSADSLESAPIAMGDANASLAADAHLPTPGLSQNIARLVTRIPRNAALWAVATILAAGLYGLLTLALWIMPGTQTKPLVVQQLRATSEPYAARLENADECVWVDNSSGPKVSERLFPGRILRLKSGLAQISFQSGATSILQGPATVEIVSNASVRLSHGRLTATADTPQSHGFVVNTPRMKITDLGTEFGVNVVQSGVEEEVHVFRGRVQVEPIGGADSFSGSPKPRVPASFAPLILAANQAARIASPELPIEQIAADDQRFVRAMPGTDVFPLFSTGVGLDRGAADSHWEIVAVSTQPDFQPQQAVVCETFAIHVADSRQMGQWISLSGTLRTMPDHCRWTLRTKFDLTGFDPATARIVGQFAVDNYLIGLRLNGKALPLPAGSKAEDLLDKLTPLRIDGGFAQGVNTLEIDIENAIQFPNQPANPMALLVRWTGTARRVNEK